MVVGLKLGCLNHAHLTRQAIEAHGVSFAGWIANGIDAAMVRAPENLAALERLLGEPPLAIIPHAPEALATLVLSEAASRLPRASISF